MEQFPLDTRGLPNKIVWGSGLRSLENAAYNDQNGGRNRDAVIKDEEVNLQEKEFILDTEISRAILHIKGRNPTIVDLSWQLLARAKESSVTPNKSFNESQSSNLSELARVSPRRYHLLEHIEKSTDSARQDAESQLGKISELIDSLESKTLFSAIACLCHGAVEWPLHPMLKSLLESKIDSLKVEDVLELLSTTYNPPPNTPHREFQMVYDKLVRWIVWRKALDVVNQTVSQSNKNYPDEECSDQEEEEKEDKEDSETEDLIREYKYRNPLRDDESVIVGVEEKGEGGIRPKHYARVISGIRWTTVNRAHVDGSHIPPKIVLGYKFAIFYPGLGKDMVPSFELLDNERPGTEILHFRPIGKYCSLAFEIPRLPWMMDERKGYRCAWKKGVLKLSFRFRRAG